MFQQKEKVGEKIEKVVKDDIWGSIKEFLDLGFTFFEGEKQIEINIGLLLLVIFSFLIASFLLKWIRVLYTRKMNEVDKQKFISVFKFIKYFVYLNNYKIGN